MLRREEVLVWGRDGCDIAGLCYAGIGRGWLGWVWETSMSVGVGVMIVERVVDAWGEKLRSRITGFPEEHPGDGAVKAPALSAHSY